MTINIAILGPGGIAEGAHAPAVAASASARLWSVYSRSAERAREFARRHNARSPTPAYTDLDELLADPELDAVLVATPDRLHAGHAMRAAAAGKHVLCEKPLVTELDDGRALLDACEQAGVVLAVGYHHRFHVGLRKLRRQVTDGLVGPPRHVRVHWTYRAPDASNWRAHDDVGRWWCLAANGTHLLDLARWFLCDTCGEVTRISAMTTNEVFRGPHEENAVVSLAFESGATAALVTSVLFDAPPRFEIYGPEGWAVGDGVLGRHGRGTIRVGEEELAFTPRDPYVDQIDDFATAIREGREPEVGGREGLRNVELLIAATG